MRPAATGTGELVKAPAKSNGLLLAIAALATVAISVAAILLLTKKGPEVMLRYFETL